MGSICPSMPQWNQGFFRGTVNCRGRVCNVCQVVSPFRDYTDLPRTLKQFPKFSVVAIVLIFTISHGIIASDEMKVTKAVVDKTEITRYLATNAAPVRANGTALHWGVQECAERMAVGTVSRRLPG